MNMQDAFRRLLALSASRYIAVSAAALVTDIGVFLTLHEPTAPMRAEAAGAGQFAMEGFEPVPRIQIVTIAEAMRLRERAVKIPLARADTFRKPAREEDRSRQSSLDL